MESIAVLSIVLIILIGAIIAFVLIKKPFSESFWGGNAGAGRSVVAIPEAASIYGGPMYSIPPGYSPAVEPRFANVNFGNNILYNPPSMANMAAADFPLSTSGNVQESEYLPQQNSQYVGNIDQFAADASQGLVANGVDPDMQTFNYDRLMVVNKRSRLRGLGDPIRGDLPIAPYSGDWFAPAVYPSVDLREGALNVIAGHDNTTSNELRALQSIYSGKAALSQKVISLGGNQSDIIVSGGP